MIIPIFQNFLKYRMCIDPSQASVADTRLQAAFRPSQSRCHQATAKVVERNSQG
jgi:hypothetical protein